MKQIKGYLEDFVKFVNWDKEDLYETDTFISYTKTVKDKEEIDKLTSYDYNSIFSNLYDTFEIIFKNEKLIRNEVAIELNFEKDDLLDYIEESLELSQYVDIEFKINKKQYYLQFCDLKDQLTNFTFFPFVYSSNFVEWIQQFDFKNLEDRIITLEKQAIFLVEDCCSSVNNNKILIAGQDINFDIIADFAKLSNLEEDKRIKDWRYEQVNWIDGPKYINPNWFYLDFSEVHIEDSIKKYFLSNTVNLIIPFISNYTITINDRDLVCTIIGRKKMNINILNESFYEQSQVSYLYKVFKWVYLGDNSDKMSILRNLITIVLCEDCGNDYYYLILSKSKNIYNTAVKNFDIYLKENVEQYFTARQKIIDLLDNKSNEVSDQISSIINSMNKTLIAFLGAIFTSIISFVQNVDNSIIYFLLVSFIIYVLIYSIYYLSFSKYRVFDIKKYYEEEVKKISNNLLGVDSTDNSVEYFDRINKNVLAFNIYWYVSVIVNIILVLIAYIALSNLDKVIEIFNIAK